jgi:hypothetical protein
MPASKSLWHDYNESLVDGSRVLIDIRSFLKSQIEKSKIMNEGKVGAPL